MKFSLKLSAVLVASVITGCASSTPKLDASAVLQKYQSVSQLKSMLDQAKQSGVDYLAPDSYKEARESYEKAFGKASEEQPGAESTAKKGLKSIDKALSVAQSSRTTLQDVLEARDKAIKAKAKIVSPDAFSDLEEKLLDATSDIEDGDIEEAKKVRVELMNEYTALEIVTMKSSISKEAKAMLEKAKDMDADDLAEATYKLAVEEYTLSTDVLNAGRAQVEKSEEHALNSIYFSKKSMFITQTVKYFDDNDVSEEGKVLWYQQQLESINKPFNHKLALDVANAEVISSIQNDIKRIQNDTESALDQNRQTEERLNIANEKIISLQGSIAMANSEHEDANTALQNKLQAEKDNNKRTAARYKKIQSMFNDDEAYVYRKGNNVLLETHAFQFKIGGSEIDSSNFDLLEKIMKAINIFGSPKIVITGHTDSSGSDAINLKLSQKRAATVTSFLRKIGKYPANRITTKGYGESRPVASNDNKAGRARNRRIEVLIVNK